MGDRLKILNEALKFDDRKILNNALKFVHEREHEEGGFTLYKGIPDTKNTYYGVKILKMFNKDPCNKEETIKWVEQLQKGRMYGIQGVFYRVNILNTFNRNIMMSEEYISRLNARTEFVSLKVAYYHAIISKILKLNNLTKITVWILFAQNEDGGFGSPKSDILKTYYAIEALKTIDISLINMKSEIIDFTRNCQTSDGEFTFVPGIYPPFIESIYTGVKIHEILDKQPDNPDKIVEFVKRLQRWGI